MARFIFKLESVLKHRRLTEDQCQRELAKHMRHRMILEQQVRGMQETLVQSKHDLGDTLVGRVDLARVAQFTRYSAQVTARAQGIVLKLAAMEKAIHQARTQLAEAIKARRALELLRERQRQQWQLAQDRREAAENDEIAVQRYARKALEIPR